MHAAVHSTASPQERDRLRRFCDAYGLTADHLDPPSREFDAQLPMDLPLSRAERAELGRSAYRMGVTQGGLVRGLLHAALRTGDVRRLHDYCADAGVTADELTTPIDRVMFRLNVSAATKRAIADVAFDTESTRSAVLRAVVLAFLAEQRRTG